MNRTLFSATIRLDADRFIRPLRSARQEVKAFSDQADRTQRKQGAFGRSMDRSAAFVGRSWSRAMTAASRSTGGFERSLGFLERRVRGLARIMKYNLIFGGLGLGAIFTGGVSAGIKFNATMEQNEIALKNFLGSTRAARKELDVLYKIAKTTPFEMTEVTAAARQLLAFGFSAKQTNSYLRTLADAGASTGAGADSMQRIVLAIGQIQAKGRVQGDELLQLTEAGIPAYRILQKELGLTKDEIAKIGELQIPAGRAITALMRGMNSLYGGASQAQARTFFGMWSTLKDTVSQTLGSVTRSAFTATKSWMGSLIGFGEDVEKIFSGPGSLGTKAAKTWRLLTSGLNDWLDGGGQQDIADGAFKIGEIFAGAINTIFGVGGGSGEKSPFYRAGSTAIKSFAAGFKDSLKSGEILTSPLGRVLEGYFLLKFGPRLLRKLAGTGAPGGGPGDVLSNALGQSVYWKTPMPVYVVGGTIPGGPGGTPVPGGKPPKNTTAPGGGSKWTRYTRIARVAGPLVAALAVEEYFRTGKFPGETLVTAAATMNPITAPAAILNATRDTTSTAADQSAFSNKQVRLGNREALQARVAELKEMAAARRISFTEYRNMLANVRANVRQDNSTGTSTDVHRQRPVGSYERPAVRRARVTREANGASAFRDIDSRLTEREASRPVQGNPMDAWRGFNSPFGGAPIAKLEASTRTKAQRLADAATDTAKKQKPKMRQAGLQNGNALGAGIAQAAPAVETGIDALFAAARARATGLATNAAAPASAFPAISNPFNATGDAPSPSAGSPYFAFGQGLGQQGASALLAGYSTGLSAVGDAPGAVPGGMNGGDGGNWGGSQPLAEALARMSGLPVTSRKRGTKKTASGGISDHWIGSKDAYAVDLATTPPAGDPIAAKLAAALGVPGYTGGSWLNKTINGYRYQLGWRTPGHFDHIHAGVNKLHGGGQFRAPSPGGEGIAILRDRERVVPASGAGRPATRTPVTVTVTGNTFNVRSEDDITSIAEQIAAITADAASNMTLVDVD